MTRTTRRDQLQPGNVFRSSHGYRLLVTEVIDIAPRQDRDDRIVQVNGHLHADPTNVIRTERYPANSTVEVERPDASYQVYAVWDNGEFLTGAKVDLILGGEIIDTETYVISCECGEQHTATDHAISSAEAWVEAQTYTLEERLGPYGIEWQREQAER